MTIEIAEYLNLRIEEAHLRLRAVSLVLNHSTSKGNVGEEVLRDIIADFLPVNYQVSSGFVIEPHETESRTSPQLDVIVFSRTASVPLYQDRGLTIITPDMLALAAECKANLTKSKLEEALLNVQSAKQSNSHAPAVIWGYRGMTDQTIARLLPELAKDIPENHRPDHIFNLQRNYVVSRDPSGGEHRWRLLHGRKFVGRAFFQAILFASNVKNLEPLLAGVQPDRTELI